MKKLQFLLLVLPLFFLISCATAPKHKALQSSALVKQIPLRDFVANVKSSYGYKVSPDGKKLAWMAVKGTGLAIFFKNIGSDSVQVINPKGRVDNYQWAQDSRTIFFHRDSFGNENYHVFKVSTDTPNAPAIDVTPVKGARATLIKVPRNDAKHVYIKHNKRDKTVFDLFRLDLKTNKLQQVAQNPGDVTNWVLDSSGKLRGRYRKISDTRKSFESLSADGKRWKKVIDWDFEDSLYVLGFTSDPNFLWVISNIGRDKIALQKMNIYSGKRQTVYSEKNVDLDSVYIDEKTHKPIFAASMPGLPHYHYFDSTIASVFKKLKLKYPEYLRLVSADNDIRNIIIMAWTEKKRDYYLYNRATGKIKHVGKNPMAKHVNYLSTTKPISYKSRDGLLIHGYLTIPKGLEGKRLPMVLQVHGGPWVRDRYGYDSEVQFLANRGYVVLQVNYRGSTGYGKRFKQAAIHEFAGKMHDDLIDGVNWAINKGIADKEKVCISGGSYGGYATLVGMTFTPDVFACGVDVVGMSNLVSLLKNTPAYWKNFMPIWHKYVGNPNNPKDRKDMESRSPLFKVNAIKNPLMIVQGANDPRVTQLESDQIVKAMRKSGKQVEYLLFKDEGHGIRKWTNRLKYYRRMEDFLAKQLGGRSAGFDYYELGAAIF